MDETGLRSIGGREDAPKAHDTPKLLNSVDIFQDNRQAWTLDPPALGMDETGLRSLGGREDAPCA